MPGLKRRLNSGEAYSAARRVAVRLTRPWLVGSLLFLCVLSGYLLSYNVDKPTHNADWYLRYTVTCAIVEQNTFAIHPYREDGRTGVGVGGKMYAQYTLGQSTAMVPLYLLGRRLAGLAHTDCAAKSAPMIVLLTCKLLDPILGALLAVLFYATARLLRYGRRAALALTALLAFGSSLWPDVLSSEEHTMESLFLLAAAYAALRYTQSGVGSRESGVESRASGVGRRASGVGRRRRHTLSTGSAGFQPADGRAGGAGHPRSARPRWLAGWRRGVSPYARALPVDTRDLWLVAMGLAAGLVFVTRVAGVIALPIFAFYLVALHGRVDSRQSIVDSETATRAMGLRRVGTLVRRAYYRLSTVDYRPLGRDLAFYALGTLPGILVNMIYDAVRFGSPLLTNPPAKPDHTLGYPPWLGLPNLLVSPGKGLLWYTPALLLLALAAHPFYRRLPLPAVLCALICSVYLLFYANVTYWHGDPAWGPRYLYATLPYLVLPLGEVFARWRGYRRPLRGLLVGVLALSFVVQFSAVSVSYWRHWYYIYSYHYDQVEDHGWGSNLNYWWKPEQSPILISLEGIADITQKYVDHAPLLEHQASQRLSDPRESSVYQVYGQAGVSLTDVDKLHDVSNWNTFTLWWAHVYPWWNLETVVRLALALAAVFLCAGGLLLTVLTLAERPLRAPPHVSPASHNGHEPPYGQERAHGNGHTSAGELRLADLSVAGRYIASHPPVGGAAGGGGALAVAARPALQFATSSRSGSTGPATGLTPVGLAALLAALLYGAIADVAALQAPRATPALIRTVGMDIVVRDGDWAYRALGVTSAPALPGGIEAPVDAAHHYVLLRLRLYNHLSRPQHARPEWFDLTDSAGLRYQFMGNLSAQVAELSHQAPVGGVIPARSSIDATLVYQVRNATPDRDLALLGPGLTLVRLSAPSGVRATSPGPTS